MGRHAVIKCSCWALHSKKGGDAMSLLRINGTQRLLLVLLLLVAMVFVAACGGGGTGQQQDEDEGDAAPEGDEPTGDGDEAERDEAAGGGTVHELHLQITP